MRIHEIRYDGPQPIEGYGPGFFRLAGRKLEGAVLIAPEGASGWGGLADAAPLLALAGQVDVLLIGTGAAMALPPGDLAARLEAAGLAWEAMASPAACRGYNVLLAEGRRVAAALLPL